MRRLLELSGIATVIAVMALFSIAGCKDPVQPDNTYTVTFDLNGGSGTAPAAMTVEAGSSIDLPSGSGLTRTGYAFGGWTTQADGTGIIYFTGFTFTPTGNVTFYAMWNSSAIETFTVTFNVNGGTGTAPAAQTVQSGSSITLPSGSGLTRDGFAFGGWNTYANGMGTNYAADSNFITPPGNITLYARWESYLVTFNVNGGSGTAPAARNVSPGSSITLPNGDGLTRNGYSFGGWNTKADGTGTNYAADSDFTPDGNVTLYAHWESYLITFDLNGGSGTAPAAQRVSPGSSITLPGESGFYRTRYTFSGWNTEADGTENNYDAASVFTPSDDVTLYAQWEVAAYSISFNANGGTGTVPSTMIVAPGNSITIPYSENMSWTYATFTNWNTKADGSGTDCAADSAFTPAGNISDIIMYAQWDITPFSSVTGIYNKLNWLKAHAQSDTSYTIEVSAGEYIADIVLEYSGKSNVIITLKGVGANRTVWLSPASSSGRMFSINSGVTLILDENITLQGGSSNNNTLVMVNSRGNLIMNVGSVVTGHTGGNGISVGSGGTFTMFRPNTQIRILT